MPDKREPMHPQRMICGSASPAIRLILTAAVCPGVESAASAPPGPRAVAPGKFQPTMASLTNYLCPEWFRDAKFGIWAHWGPEAVPMAGDRYTCGMYEPGNRHYK